MQNTQAIEDKAVAQEQQTGAVDVDKIIAEMQIQPNLKDVFDKMLLSGMRLMFDKRSHEAALEQLNKEGPMDQKLAEGIVAVMYLLWTQSNQTLPMQLIIPATVALTLRAYEFLEKSGDPEANPAMLGEAMDLALDTVCRKFGMQGGVEELLQRVQQEGKQGGKPPQAQGLLQEAQNG